MAGTYHIGLVFQLHANCYSFIYDFTMIAYKGQVVREGDDVHTQHTTMFYTLLTCGNILLGVTRRNQYSHNLQ